jgi:hypothetical protein
MQILGHEIMKRKIVLAPVTSSIGPYQWHDPGPAADRWEQIRIRMNPVPLPAKFIALCDEYEHEALLFGEWDKWTLIDYIQGRLLPKSSFRAIVTIMESVETSS